MDVSITPEQQSYVCIELQQGVGGKEEARCGRRSDDGGGGGCGLAAWPAATVRPHHRRCNVSHSRISGTTATRLVHKCPDVPAARTGLLGVTSPFRSDREHYRSDMIATNTCASVSRAWWRRQADGGAACEPLDPARPAECLSIEDSSSCRLSLSIKFNAGRGTTEHRKGGFVSFRRGSGKSEREGKGKACVDRVNRRMGAAGRAITGGQTWAPSHLSTARRRRPPR